MKLNDLFNPNLIVPEGQPIEAPGSWTVVDTGDCPFAKSALYSPFSPQYSPANPHEFVIELSDYMADLLKALRIKVISYGITEEWQCCFNFKDFVVLIDWQKLNPPNFLTALTLAEKNRKGDYGY